jgi:hypothetical protein
MGFKRWAQNVVSSIFGIERYDSPVAGRDELDERYLFDFRNYQADTIQTVAAFGRDAEAPIPKIQVSPKAVLNELETVPSPVTLAGLDAKIDLLKQKQEIIRQKYSRRDISGLLERLKNRKVYAEHKEFFEAFPNTTDEKIGALLEKYDLQSCSADLFIPEFPDEAVKVMREYEAETVAVCGKKPVFYVIATADSFRKVTQRRDPILLAQSPFGFYWQILGAWDEEMLLLSEL